METKTSLNELELGTDWLSAAEAAELAGVSAMAVSKWVKDRKVAVRMVGSFYRIDPASLSKFLLEREATRKSKGSASVPLVPSKADWDEADGVGRTCTVCGREWPLSKKFWHEQNSSKYLSGFHTSCKLCRLGNPVPGSDMGLGSGPQALGQGGPEKVLNLVVQTGPVLLEEASELWQNLSKFEEVLEMRADDDRLGKVRCSFLIDGNSQRASEIRNPASGRELTLALGGFEAAGWWNYPGSTLEIAEVAPEPGTDASLAVTALVGGGGNGQ
jgi:excisionase family DNA binding protein